MIITELLPTNFKNTTFVDLCCGDGNLLKRIYKNMPDASLIGLDLSEKMLEASKKTLYMVKENQISLQKFKIEDSDWRNKLKGKDINGVVSSLAIHHLNNKEKQLLFKDIYEILKPGGAFIIADLIKPINNYGKHISAKCWDLMTQKRSLETEQDMSGFDAFQKLEWNYYSDPNAENDPIDKPSDIRSQLQWLEDGGFEEVDIFWMNAGHAIFGGYKNFL